MGLCRGTSNHNMIQTPQLDMGGSGLKQEQYRAKRRNAQTRTCEADPVAWTRLSGVRTERLVSMLQACKAGDRGREQSGPANVTAPARSGGVLGVSPAQPMRAIWERQAMQG